MDHVLWGPVSGKCEVLVYVLGVWYYISFVFFRKCLLGRDGEAFVKIVSYCGHCSLLGSSELRFPETLPVWHCQKSRLQGVEGKRIILMDLSHFG